MPPDPKKAAEQIADRLCARLIVEELLLADGEVHHKIHLAAVAVAKEVMSEPEDKAAQSRYT